MENLYKIRQKFSKIFQKLLIKINKIFRNFKKSNKFSIIV